MAPCLHSRVHQEVHILRPVGFLVDKQDTFLRELLRGCVEVMENGLERTTLFVEVSIRRYCYESSFHNLVASFFKVT